MMATAAVLMLFAAALMMVCVAMCLFPTRFAPLTDFRIRLHRPGDSGQPLQQSVRVFRRQTKLSGGKGNDRLLHLGQRVEFGLNLRRAVGAVQISNEINLFFHRASPFFDLSYEHPFMCLQPVYSHFPPLSREKWECKPFICHIFQFSSSMTSPSPEICSISPSRIQ